MRLDKFLKGPGIFKRRTLAQKVIEAGYVRVDGRIAKPSTEVKQGDIIEIDTPVAYSKYLVLSPHAPAADIIEERKKLVP